MKIIVLSALVLLVQGTLDLSNYKTTFLQDFTNMKNLSVSPNGPTGDGTGGTSIFTCHCLKSTDYVDFLNPSADYTPFSLDNSVLTIRTQKIGNSYTSGILNTFDNAAKGFSQQFGYFELKAKLPKGPSTWPAFWLLDTPSITDNTIHGTEIDIFEQYGTSTTLYVTLHYWQAAGTSGPASTGKQFYSNQCSMSSGFHTYGLDYQQDYLTVYFDRMQLFRIQNDFSAILGSAYQGSWNAPMYVLFNNAPDPNSDLSKLDGNPQDMLVEYVQVWQGSGGSNGAHNYPFSNSYSMGWDGASITPTSPIKLNGATLELTVNGSFQVVDSNNKILWQSNTSHDCSQPASKCYTDFQGDGNFVVYTASGGIWGTSTYNTGAIGFIFQSFKPYLQIVNGNCTAVWSTGGESPPPPIPSSATSASTTPSTSSATFTTIFRALSFLSLLFAL